MKENLIEVYEESTETESELNSIPIISLDREENEYIDNLLVEDKELTKKFLVNLKVIDALGKDKTAKKYFEDSNKRKIKKYEIKEIKS